MPSKKRESVSIRREVFYRLRVYVQASPDLYMGPIIEELITKMLDNLEVPPMSSEEAAELAKKPKISLNNPESRGLPRDPQNVTKSRKTDKERKIKKRIQADLFQWRQQIEL